MTLVSNSVKNEGTGAKAKRKYSLKVELAVPLDAEERPVLSPNRARAECTLDVHLRQVGPRPVLKDEADGVIHCHVVQTEIVNGNAVIDAFTEGGGQVVDGTQLAVLLGYNAKAGAVKVGERRSGVRACCFLTKASGA